MPLRNCREPGCPEFVTDAPRCPAHTRADERGSNRSGHTDAYKRAKWHRTRRQVQFDRPLCPGFGGEPCGEIGTHCDHILATEDGGPMFDQSNLQMMCEKHHGQKTNFEVRHRTY